VVRLEPQEVQAMAFVHRHNHFGLHSLSRRQFLGAAAATAGALATGLRIPTVFADNDKLATVFPLPIPGGTPIAFPDGFSTLVHHFPSTANNDSLPISEPSEITDFNGVVGLDRTVGTGVDNSGNTLHYQVDNGFMSGLYRGEDGRMHHGTFAFL
jgi:hypothetical protein